MKRSSVVVIHRDESNLGRESEQKHQDLEWIHIVPTDLEEVQVAAVTSSVWIIRYPRTYSQATAAQWFGATFASGEWILFVHAGNVGFESDIEELQKQSRDDAGMLILSPPADLASLAAQPSLEQLNRLFKLHFGGFTLFNYPHAMNRKLLHQVSPVHVESPFQLALKCIPHSLQIYLSAKSSKPIFHLRPLFTTNNSEQLSCSYLESIFLNLVREYGVRGGFTDLNRKRSLMPHPTVSLTLLEDRQNDISHDGSRDLSVVIPVQNEETTLAALLLQVNKLNPKEIIVVANGSTDASVAIARKNRCRVVEFAESIGHDVGRSVGAMHATGQTLLFIDGDMVVTAEELEPFVKTIEAGADLALNDIRPFTAPADQWDIVTNLKFWLNFKLGREDLAIASLTAVPHAINRRQLGAASIRNLAVPPKAYAEFIARGADVRLAAAVDVLTKNRRRPAHQGKRNKGNPMEQLIVGDHLEAFAWLLDHASLASSMFVAMEGKFRAIKKRSI